MKEIVLNLNAAYWIHQLKELTEGYEYYQVNFYQGEFTLVFSDQDQPWIGTTGNAIEKLVISGFQDRVSWYSKANTLFSQHSFLNTIRFSPLYTMDGKVDRIVMEVF